MIPLGWELSGALSVGCLQSKEACKVSDHRVNALQVVGGGSVFSYAPCFVNLAPAAVSAFATGISVAPSLAVITPEGVNIQPQGLNIQPVRCCPLSVVHACVDPL